MATGDNFLRALDFVYPAYQLSEERWSSVDRRLEAVIAGAAIPIPLFVDAANGRPLLCWLFVVGILLLVGTAGCALWGRSAYKIKRMNLGQVEQSARQSDDTFARQMLVTAENHITTNDSRTTAKTRFALAATGLLFAGIGCLTLWLIFTA